MFRRVFLAAVISAGIYSHAEAQTGPVVTSASFLEWDYNASASGVTAFRVYLSRNPGVVPDASPDATVAYPTKAWAVVAAPGQWYAVVTAVAGTAESGPSNEVPFFVLEAPSNLRVRIP
jgi:hypothetical protein